jgi:hypothetical protein
VDICFRNYEQQYKLVDVEAEILNNVFSFLKKLIPRLALEAS